MDTPLFSFNFRVTTCINKHQKPPGELLAESEARNHFRFLTLGRREPLDGQHLEVTSNLELLDISENHLTQIEV